MYLSELLETAEIICIASNRTICSNHMIQSFAVNFIEYIVLNKT